MKAVISLMYLSYDIENPYDMLSEFMRDVCYELGLRQIKSKRKYSKNNRAVLTTYVWGWKKEYFAELFKKVRERFKGKVRIFVRVL